jgi:hypothetical protein
MPMIMSMPNLIVLGSVELTDEGRDPLQTEYEPRIVEVELANGSKKRYIKGKNWRKWDITWSNTAKDATQSIDGFGARDEILTLAMTPGAKSLVIEEKEGLFETYTVFIDSWSETILQRRVDDAGSRYSVSLTLVEAE